MNDLDGYRQLYGLSAQIPDWRSDLGKLHRLTEILFIMVVALIAGAQDCEDIHGFGDENENWLRQLLTLKHGIPHHDMYLRTLAAVPAEQFEALVRAWTSWGDARQAGAAQGRRQGPRPDRDARLHFVARSQRDREARRLA